MIYEDLVVDFADRTLKNLEFVKEQSRQTSPAASTDVTQLINSMLGLIILPRERHFESIPDLTLKDLERAGWPKQFLEGEFDPPKTLKPLIRVLRNGIAHWNIEFTERDGHISGVVLWNEVKAKVCGCAPCSVCRKDTCGCAREPRKNWRVRLSIEDLETLIRKFKELVCRQQPMTSRSSE